MADEVVFAIGDRVVVDVHSPTSRREGKIIRLPHHSDPYPTRYLVMFTSGSTSYLTTSEIEHVDVVTRLAELSS